MRNTLQSVERSLAGRYEPHLLLVDDGSSDATWEILQREFAAAGNYRLVRHAKNQGVAAAILTGIRSAETEIVCSMDCDCSYDPHELLHMIPLLSGEVDLVTASPYHPQGRVRNVPGWRLFLSKSLSRLYRLVLRQKLSTYTSCFRVYRRDAVRGLTLSENGFLGIAEIVGRLSAAGARIVEYPTTLHVRIFGESKMKTLRTIVGHLRLLWRLAAAGSAPSGPRPPSRRTPSLGRTAGTRRLQAASRPKPAAGCSPETIRLARDATAVRRVARRNRFVPVCNL